MTLQKFSISLPCTVEIRHPSSALMQVLEQDPVLIEAC